MRIDSIDYRILSKFYENERWQFNIFSVTDISKFFNNEIEIPTLRHHIRKLVKYRFIEEQDTFPKFWMPVQDLRQRKQIEKMCSKFKRTALGVD